MHTRKTAAISLIVLLSLGGALAGCARNEAATPTAAAPTEVDVAKVVSREITEFEDFTGRFEAVERVELRPRVSGYIASVEFEEGREVRKGDVLFTIDPRPYEAELKRAKAELARARTQLSLAQSERDRAIKLLEARAISQEEFDARVSGTEQAEANVQAAEAAVDAAALNLTFTRVRAPISGLVSRAEITTGNLVTAGQTLLTTVVSLDPIYVTFEGTEQLAQRVSQSKERNRVWAGLGDESGYPHQGELVFVDNEVNPDTGTIRARGLLRNEDRRFTPGMFARVRVADSNRHPAVLIKDSAISTDQSIKYVLVVNDQNTVEYRAVKLGPIVDGLRVVREGLNPGEAIVVSGLQRVRPGVQVEPQYVAMTDEDEAQEGELLAQSAVRTTR
ncbi:MAG TPA: efflux RND transporter periplasmic adaptor subunit [Steroidobacteraceae bacterium]